MSLKIQNCSASDAEAAIPFMFSSGPDAFRYVLSSDYAEEALEFLHSAFAKGGGEFGYRNHVMAFLDEVPVALVGLWEEKDNFSYTIDALKNILAFYGVWKGLAVLLRGLHFQRCVAPPRKGVLYLHNFGVSESHRGQGIGSQVIDFVVEEAAKRGGIQAVSLYVAADNPAKKLYLRKGFVLVKESDLTLQGRFSRTSPYHYMEKPLG
ncbi:MAG: N-acetyltransferase [Spirochaetota bacterium]